VHRLERVPELVHETVHFRRIGLKVSTERVHSRRQHLHVGGCFIRHRNGKHEALDAAINNVNNVNLGRETVSRYQGLSGYETGRREEMHKLTGAKALEKRLDWLGWRRVADARRIAIFVVGYLCKYSRYDTQLSL